MAEYPKVELDWNWVRNGEYERIIRYAKYDATTVSTYRKTKRAAKNWLRALAHAILKKVGDE